MDEISGFSRTEYLITFQSIIFGFVATLFLAGWGDLLRVRHKLTQSGNFILFTGLVFLVMLIHWWNLYGRAEIMGDSIMNFLSALPYSILFYFISVQAFGPMREGVKAEGKIALSDTFHRAKNWLLFLLLGFFAYDLAVTLHKDAIIFRVFAIGVCVAGLMIQSQKLMKGVLIGSVVIIGLYILLDFMNLIAETAIRKTYSRVEHLTIFISIIYGYVITIYFEGWAGLFKMKSMAFSTTQFLWSLFSFLFLIDIWWSSWSRTAIIDKDILHFIVFLLVPFIIYLIGILLFPKSETESYETHFYSNKNLFFALFATLLIVQIILSRLFVEHAGSVNYFRASGVVLALVAIKVRSLIFHRILVSIAFILLLVKELLA